MSEFVRHEQCPKCGSSDNVGVWVDALGNESKYCFTEGCDYNLNVGSSNHLHLPELKYGDLTNRGISKRTCVKYGVGVNDGKLFFPYYKDGKLTSSKYRNKYKDFAWLGNNSDSTLFGSNLFCKGGKQLIITEGECDALASYQMTRIPSVSIPNGSKNARKSIQKNLEYIESFKKVFICFDADESGVNACDEVMDVIKAGKAYRVSLVRKDACEYLANDDIQSFKDCVANAQPKRVDAYYTKEKLHEQWLSYFSGGGEQGDNFGIENLDNLGVSMRKGELTSIYANPSVGKSTLVRQVAANLLNMGRKVLICAFEELPIKYYALVTGMMHGVKICSKNLSIREREDLFLSVQDKLFLSTITGSTSIEDLETKLEYTIRSEDIDYIVFDNITKYTACSRNQTDDIQRVLSVLYTISQSFKVHTLCVSHTRRDKDLKEGEAPSMFSGFNSGAIERFSDIVITMGRELETDICNVAVRKDRHGNKVGECTLFFSKVSGTFKGASQATKPKPDTVKLSQASDEQSSDGVEFSNDMPVIGG